MSSDMHKDPEIIYPCNWDFTIIGSNENEMRAAIVEVVGYEVEHVSRGNTSSGGRYMSLRFSVLVLSEIARNKLYTDLANHSSIRIVL